jgi:hypothetical protein
MDLDHGNTVLERPNDRSVSLEYDVFIFENYGREIAGIDWEGTIFRPVVFAIAPYTFDLVLLI